MTEEKEKIDKVLATIKPDFVSSLSVKLDEDATGQPAVWVWVVITDEKLESPSPELENKLQAFRNQIGETLRANGIERWPYVRLQAVSEVKMP